MQPKVLLADISGALLQTKSTAERSAFAESLQTSSQPDTHASEPASPASGGRRGTLPVTQLERHAPSALEEGALSKAKKEPLPPTYRGRVSV